MGYIPGDIHFFVGDCFIGTPVLYCANSVLCFLSTIFSLIKVVMV